MALAQLDAGLLDRDRLLGDQDHVGAAGDSAHHRDPAGVAAHHLDHHHAVVRLGRRVQPVDRLGADRDRGVEAEGVVGRREVVVDRLRHADDRQLVLRVEACGDAERVLAADRDQRVEPRLGEVPQHALDAAVDLVRIRPGGADDRARRAAGVPETSRLVSAVDVAVDQPAPAVADADHLVAAPEERRATARITAFSPGQSPPPVRIPTRFIAGQSIPAAATDMSGRG